MSKIAIFYHIGQVGEIWQLIVQEQLHALALSGLLKACDKFIVGVNGNQELPFLPEKAEVTRHPENEWKEETATIKMLRDFCRENDNYKVFYFHSKGATNPSASVQSWRLVLEYYCVHNWKTCVNDLEDYDCVGCFWADEKINDIMAIKGFAKAPPHFSSNFWWSKSKYINKLKDDLLNTVNRYDREFWVGSENPSTVSYGKNILPIRGDYFYFNYFVPSDKYVDLN